MKSAFCKKTPRFRLSFLTNVYYSVVLFAISQSPSHCRLLLFVISTVVAPES